MKTKNILIIVLLIALAMYMADARIGLSMECRWFSFKVDVGGESPVKILIDKGNIV